MSQDLTNKTDRELWLLLRFSNKEAFALIYKRHIQTLYNFGLKLTSDKELISDTIQDLFTEFWEKRHTTKEVSYLKIYLIKAFRYKLLRAVTKKNKKGRLLSFEELFLEIPDEIKEEESAIERKQLLKEHLKILTERQREVIHLRYYHNLTNDEIAEIINVNYQSVSNILYRAITKLRKKLVKNSFRLLEILLIVSCV